MESKCPECSKPIRLGTPVVRADDASFHLHCWTRLNSQKLRIQSRGLIRASQAAIDSSREALARSGVAMARLDGLRIVVVDDHLDTLDIIQTVLASLGAIVRPVTRAREALALVADADLIVTDFLMPDEDGLWLLEQVNLQPRPIPVMLVSGFAQEQVPQLADAPFARKLLKPVDPWELSGIVHEMLAAGDGRPAAGTA